jgi:hypothetical protein
VTPFSPQDFFRPELDALGYDSVWRKRPRPGSADGCCGRGRYSHSETTLYILH